MGRGSRDYVGAIQQFEVQLAALTWQQQSLSSRWINFVLPALCRMELGDPLKVPIS
jgi:hypothetical protein